MKKPEPDGGLVAHPEPQDGANSEKYAEDTPLTWVFGNHPEPKLIAAYMSERFRDINVTTVAEIAGLSRSAVYNHRDELEEFGIINQTREMGGGDLHQLNQDNEFAKLLFTIEDKLLDEWYQSVDPEAPLEDNLVVDRDDESEPLQDIEEPYADDTPLTFILGNHPEVKIVASLLSERGRDISVTDIARLADVSRNDVYEHLETLKEYNLVEQTRKMGRSKLYMIDYSKKSIQLIHQLENRLLMAHYDRIRE